MYSHAHSDASAEDENEDWKLSNSSPCLLSQLVYYKSSIYNQEHLTSGRECVHVTRKPLRTFLKHRPGKETTKKVPDLSWDPHSFWEGQ